ncbi:MAG: putative DNA binding domain-containing protein, partial [Candidatus Omnitrophica bacterium]|nr:putative DNA binding domain-containing protein [Candidatus Omnitrophota bacterium]
MKNVNLQQLEEIINLGEALEREFKSDSRREFSDNEIYEEIVALANTDGGALLIGVEDNGQVTGSRARHNPRTDPMRLQSAIFNNTVPSINTRISLIDHPDGEVLAIEVDPYPEPCATTQGRSLHRVIGADGKPATVPFYPRDQRSRRVDLGLLDFSAQTMEGVSFDDLDPLEFERLKQIVKRLHGDQHLLSLPNSEIAKALKLVESEGTQLRPNISGILLLGKESLISDLIPTHSVHFQVIDAKGEVRVNKSFQWPLLRTLDEVEQLFLSRNEEREVMSGLFRIPVPDYSEPGVREAINNAVLHRDYSKLGSAYFQWHPDHILITNPGGFPEGITMNNLLVHEPKPRNPRLAEAFKRIGLVEQTGRGVDRIYLGQLRYGRPIPDYSRSDDTGVRVVLRGGAPSLKFAEFVYEQEKEGKPLNLDELLVLNALHFERRIDSESAGQLIQKGTSEGRAVLEQLHERGLVEAKGERRGRVYHLAASLYKRFQMESEYVRAKGFAPHQHEQ